MSIVAESNIAAAAHAAAPKAARPAASASSPAVADRAARLTGQPAHRLDLRVQSGDGYAVVTVWGELYTSRLGELTRLLDALVRAGGTRVLLDISRLYDLDGDAISELSRWQSVLRSSGGGLWLAGPRPWVRRLLDHMCLRGTFTVFPTVSEAIAEIAPSLLSSVSTTATPPAPSARIAPLVRPLAAGRRD